MKRSRLRIGFQLSVLAAGLFTCRYATAAYAVAPEPLWVEAVSFETCHQRKGELTDGTCRLLSDVQLKVDGEAQREYHHYAAAIMNQKGLEAESEIEIDFAPAVETVALHYVRIHRSGKILDRLRLKNVTEMRRESALEERMLIGDVTLHIIVDDVRPGDVLEYAFTIEGASGVLDGQFYNTQWLAWSVPVQKVLCRLITPKNYFLQYKLFRTDAKPIVRELPDGLVDYRIYRENVRSVIPEADVPVWFDPMPRIQFSTARAWADVAKWGQRLYVEKPPVSLKLQEEIDRIAALSSDPTSRAGSALAFVQDEIRYLGIEIGDGSFVPTAPDNVLKRRFGDCKDKTFLLITMLRALRIEAYPLLVNLDLLEHVRELLPSAAAFNHVIAAIELDGKTYFADPTARSRRGAFTELVQPDFGVGLLLKERTTALTELPRRVLKAPTKIIEEVYDGSAGPGFPATLSVKTELLDEEADLLQDQLSEQGQSAFIEDLLRFYQVDFPAVEPTRPTVLSFDSDKNRIVIEEQYLVPDFWTPSPDGKAMEGRLFPREIYGHIASPVDVGRKMPLAVPYPVYVLQQTRVILPPGMSPPVHSVREGDAAFEFRRDVRKEDRGYRIAYSFRTLFDFVPTRAAGAHQRKREKIGKTLGVTLSTAARQERPVISVDVSLFPWYLLLGMIAVLAIVAGTIGTRRIYQADPTPPRMVREGTSEASIGPLLGLLGVLLAVIPVLEAYGAVGVLTAFRPEALAAVLSGASTSTPILYMIRHLVAVSYFIVSPPVSALLIVLYLRRRRIFPRVFIATSLIRGLLYGVDFLATRLIFYAKRGSMDDAFLIGAALVVSAACLYLGVSSRGRAVFVQKRLAGTSERAESDVKRA